MEWRSDVMRFSLLHRFNLSPEPSHQEIKCTLVYVSDEDM